MANRTKWTHDMIVRLHELRARNFTVLEIAQDMGLDFSVVQSRINYEKSGKTAKSAKPAPIETPEMSKQVPTEPEAPNDVVNHPAHYTAGGIECIDAIRAATTGLIGFEAYCTGTILKYIWRWKHKNGLEDLRKAGVYLDWLMQEVANE